MALSRDDVANLYLIVLGRPIENSQTADQYAALDAVDCIRRLLPSSEFEGSVLRPVLEGGTLRQAALAPTTLAKVKAWAEQFRQPLFGEKVAEYSKWHQFLLDALTDDAVAPAFAQHYPDHASFLERLAATIARTDTVVGAIEEINNVRCRGYVVDAEDPARDLALRLRLNGGTVALVPVLQYRREFQEKYGGTGRVGFEIDFEAIPAFADLEVGFIELVEASTGFVLLASHKLAFSRLPELRARDLVLEALHGYRAVVADLIAQLEGHGSQSVISLAGYGRHRDFARRLPPPAASSRIAVVIEGEGAEAANVALLLSLARQSYPPRSVIVAGSGKAGFLRPAERDALAGLPIRHVSLGEPVADALRASEADRVVLLRPGECLEPDALAWLAYASERPGAKAIFADSEEAVTGPRNVPTLVPVFRSAMDIDLLLASDEYDTPVCVAKDELAGSDGSAAPLDRLALLLACLERHGRCAFRHVPLVLSRRAAPDASEREAEAERRRAAVQAYLDRAHPGASAVPHEDGVTGAVPGRSRLRWPVPEPARVSVIVPTKDSVDMVVSLLASLKQHTARLSRLRVYVVSNNSSAPQTPLALDALREDALVTVLDHDRPFNWAEINDRVIREEVEDGIVVCLNNDMICQTPGWDDLLRGQLARPGLGLVGGRLLYANGLLQHAGIAMAGDWRHEAAGDPPSHGLYRDRTRVAHEVPAVTGAFLALTRDLYLDLGGFDALSLPVTYNDVDLCLRAEKRGIRTLYDPEQVWVHFESETRGFDSADAAKQERDQAASDLVLGRLVRPDYRGLSVNPHFPRHTRPFSIIAWPSLEEVESWIDQQETRNAESPSGSPAAS